MEVKKYLSRIGVDGDNIPAPGYELLKMLQYNHVLTVPYENLDIISGKALSLELEDVYKKVVTDGRGGYCFELNRLFEWLLCELRFKTESYSARFWRGESGIPQRRHRVIAAFIEGKTYISDVGIGSPAPRIPLLLEEGTVQEFFGESYRFERDSEFGWVLYELSHGEWRRYFSFTEDKAQEIDFVMPSFYCEKHPDSKFNKSLMVAIKTAEGRKSIDGNVYKEFVGNKLSLIKENISDKRLSEILKSEFGLTVKK